MSKEAREAIVAEQKQQIVQQKLLEAQKSAEEAAFAHLQATAAAQLHRDLLQVLKLPIADQSDMM